MISAFIARSSFWKGKKWAADLDAQLQGELDTETLKTTRPLSVVICRNTTFGPTSVLNLGFTN